ncbi:MAG: glutathione S-transferase, partial [Methylobacter sp.]|nr:glutathione S-transferase [Methylobacter sp.]
GHLLSYQSIAVNGSERQHKADDFLKMNPFGQVPVLTDGDTVIRDSQAILVYLARKYGNELWLPTDAAALGEVTAWLSSAANEMAMGPNRLRLHFKFGRAINLDESRQITSNLLNILQQRLDTHRWLAADQITVADIAVYPYIALAQEGKIDLEPYPAVIAWIKRIQALPGYVGMPGMRQSEQLANL